MSATATSITLAASSSEISTFISPDLSSTFVQAAVEGNVEDIQKLYPQILALQKKNKYEALRIFRNAVFKAFYSEKNIQAVMDFLLRKRADFENGLEWEEINLLHLCCGRMETLYFIPSLLATSPQYLNQADSDNQTPLMHLLGLLKEVLKNPGENRNRVKVLLQWIKHLVANGAQMFSDKKSSKEASRNPNLLASLVDLRGKAFPEFLDLVRDLLAYNIPLVNPIANPLMLIKTEYVFEETMAFIKLLLFAGADLSQDPLINVDERANRGRFDERQVTCSKNASKFQTISSLVQKMQQLNAILQIKHSHNVAMLAETEYLTETGDLSLSGKTLKEYVAKSAAAATKEFISFHTAELQKIVACTDNKSFQDSDLPEMIEQSLYWRALRVLFQRRESVGLGNSLAETPQNTHSQTVTTEEVKERKDSKECKDRKDLNDHSKSSSIPSSQSRQTYLQAASKSLMHSKQGQQASNALTSTTTSSSSNASRSQTKAGQSQKAARR